MLIGLGIIVLVVGFLILGLGSNTNSGGGHATDLVPVDPASRVKKVSVDPSLRGAPKKDLPPNSTLGFRGRTVSSAGEILGIWEPEGVFARSNGGPASGRMDGSLGLSDGDLLRVPRNAELIFVYGGEPGSMDFLDVVAFEVEKGELEYGEDIDTLSLEAGKRNPAHPVVLPLSGPDPTGRKRTKVRAELPPGVYVISVAAAVPEGGVRYNFRVAVVSSRSGGSPDVP